MRHAGVKSSPGNKSSCLTIVYYIIWYNVLLRKKVFITYKHFHLLHGPFLFRWGQIIHGIYVYISICICVWKKYIGSGTC